MNRFGEFLYMLRKEKGITQAALAEKLGVTNKAVSKWETGEAMPETGLLLPIAEIFGVTVDELLCGKRTESGDQAEPPVGASEITDGHIFTRGKDDPETPLDKICGIVCAIVALGGIAAYLFLGAFANLWHPYWIIIPVCALGCGMIGLVFHLCDVQKRNRKLAEGKNPYTDAACGFIMLSCIIAYLLCGALANLWHPYWVILIGGIAVDGVLGAIGNYAVSNKNSSPKGNNEK